MSAGVVVKATLLIVAVQFSIQDAEGQLFGTTCIYRMVREQSLEGLKHKLPEDRQPSLPESVMYWAEKQFPLEKGECGEFSDEHFRNVIKEVYGRSFVINLVIKSFIIGWKAVFLYNVKAVLFLLLSDAVESVFEYFDCVRVEYFDCVTVGKVVGAVWNIVAGAIFGKKLWGGTMLWGKKITSPVAVVLGMGLGLGPWIYCEARLESIARLAGSESYYKSELTNIVMNK